MSKTGKTTGSDALSSFKALEERVGRVLKALVETRQENVALTEKLRDARRQAQQLESEVRKFHKDQKTIRTQVQHMIREISKLERESAKTREKRVV